MRELRAERRAQKIITQRQEELRVAAMTPNKKKKNGGNNAVNDPSIPPELSKHLLQMYNPDESKRIPNETAMAISEVLKTFVVEATSRASIEAECDLEGAMEDDHLKENNAGDYVPIRADHITKIAAELLMDFS